MKPLIIDYDDDEFPQGGAPLVRSRLRAGPRERRSRIQLAPARRRMGGHKPSTSTSGTTGNPKGVVYHHRGADADVLLERPRDRHGPPPVYLWTLPMFHCNGWCFPWTLSVVAGTHVCLRWVRAKAMYDAIVDHKVTNLSGAPIVMSTLLNAKNEEKRIITHRVAFNHAAAPPPEAVLARMAEAGFELTHLYGLTETYGPAVLNEWHSSWDSLPPAERLSQARPSGRPLCRARRPHSHGSGDHDRRCPPTAKPWARSCSGATSS